MRSGAFTGRTRDLQLSRVRVTVDGSTVKLTGLVKCWHDREVAEAAAWSAPGVERVVNELIGV
ncbi:MAG TPA: BON domain-containing protein [Caldimonas sp.]|jgi:osmotically-inducible protein OsmY